MNVAVTDAVARYRAASDANDIDALIDTMSPDIEVVSPISGRMVFHGRDDVHVLMSAVYSSINGLHWHHEVGDEHVRVVLGEGRVGPFPLGDAMVIHLDDDGRIRRISPHLRPWLGLTLLAIKLGPRVARRPGMIVRALQRG